MIKKLGKLLSLDYVWYALRGWRRVRSFSATFAIPSVPSKDIRANGEDPIDLVIPVIDKDAGTLPYVIDSAREYIHHPLGELYLVCPPDSRLIKRIAGEKKATLIDERALVDIAPGDIQYRYQGKNRANWIFQQFLKWSGGKFCKSKKYLVMDSDTVFLRPQPFQIDKRMVFDVCDEYHRPYFMAFERLFGFSSRSEVSFTSHHSLIDIGIMDELMEFLEARHGKPWYRAIADNIDQSEMSCVSDYDNYALYVLARHPEQMAVRYWANKSVSRNELGNLEALRRNYRGKYNTLSFHSWNT